MDQKAVKVDEHYKLPLPLKDEDIQLPNNRVATMKCLESLRKFKKDDRFFKYKNVLVELMEKGYTRKCDGKELDGKIWYVPHQQGVLNHNKGKIYVVFDCSSQYRGTSINENLLFRHNLTS